MDQNEQRLWVQVCPLCGAVLKKADLVIVVTCACGWKW